MKKLLAAAALAALPFTAAQATISVCLGTGAACDPVGSGDLENVLFDDEVGATVTGTTNQTGLGVAFSSSTDTLEAFGGQAKLESFSDDFINQLTVQMENPIFGLEVIRFSVAAAADGLIELGYTDQLDNTVTNNYFVSSSGRNWFTFLATDPDQMKEITIAGENITGIEDMKHFRIDPDLLPGGVDPQEVAAPGTIALLGLGLMALIRARSTS